MFLFDALGKLLWWLIKGISRLIWWMTVQMVKHPRSVLSSAAGTVAVVELGWQVCAAAVGTVVVGTAIWKQAHPTSWDATAGKWTRTWVRRWFRYRRVWARTMTRCGLVVQDDNDVHHARLTKVATTPYWDRLTVRLLVGQEVSDFVAAGERLRHAFGAQRVVVREIRPAGVGIDLMRRDPLRAAVPATPLLTSSGQIDYRAIPVGVTEFGEPLTLSMVGGHTAVAGASGAGKASAEWNVLRGLAPAIADRSVVVHGVDPKRVELSQALGEVIDPENYACDESSTVDLLQRLVDQLAETNKAAAARGERDHVPSPAHPLNLLVIDEFAPLLVYWKRSVRDKIEDLLGLLLTQGRSAGFIVFGEIQEPTKDIFRCRDLFGRRIALRLPTEAHTDAALTEKASDRGALCHEIPEDMPGTLFSLESGARTAVRGRLGHVTNDGIRELCEHVTALRSVSSLDAHRTAAARKAAA